MIKAAMITVIGILIVPPYILIVRSLSDVLNDAGVISSNDSFWVSIIPFAIALAPFVTVGVIIYRKFWGKKEIQE